MRVLTIKEFEKYSISENGMITNVITGNIIRCRSNNGYSIVTLSNNLRKKTFFLHRLLAESFIPNPENKPCVNHKNKVRNDNRIENLEWATYKENAQHSATGVHRHSVGRKLTPDQVRQIRLMYDRKTNSHREVAEEFGVKRETVRDIINNRIWKNTLTV